MKPFAYTLTLEQVLPVVEKLNAAMDFARESGLNATQFAIIFDMWSKTYLQMSGISALNTATVEVEKDALKIQKLAENYNKDFVKKVERET